MQRVRAGDPKAAADLVRSFEPQIQRVIRMRMTDPHLCRILDSTDICQSVLANFFVRVVAGQFELDSPEQLLKLLVTMARNKLLNQAQRYQARRRDQRRDRPNAAALETIPGREGTPSQIVADKELLQKVRQQLSTDENYLAEQRALGRDWASLATELHASPEALRKKLTRALDRVSRKLGFE